MGVVGMVPEVIRMKRPGVCGCGEFISAGQRAEYAGEPDSVVCLACMDDRISGETGRPATREEVVVPASWTAGVSTIEATLAALRSQLAPAGELVAAGQLVTAGELQVAERPTVPASVPVAAVPAQPEPEPEGAAESDLVDVVEAVAPLPLPPLPRRVPGALVAEESRRARRRRGGFFSRLPKVHSIRIQYIRSKVADDPDAAVRSLLDAAGARGVLSLHDRRVPGRRAHVGHVAIGPSGVYVVDVKHFKNAAIERRASPGGDPAADDLVVGGQVMTDSLAATRARVAALRSAMATEHLEVPVTGVVCFVDGLMPLMESDLEVGGVHVVRPNDLAHLVAAAGIFGEEHRETLREFLAEQLPESA